MRQVPFFAPHGDEHVAALLTLPDEPPRGLVVTLTGTGLYQVIGSKFCARTAARLAEDGLAAVRLDYLGVGDSTGLVSGWRITDVEEVLRQARAALDVAMRSAGVSQFAVAGTCYGSRVALRLLDDPACVGAVCLASPMLEFGGWTTLRRTLRDRPVFSYIRTQPHLRRLIVVPIRSLLKERKPAQRVVAALSHLDRARLLFLYSENADRDHYSEAAAQRLTAAVSALPDEQRARFDLRILQTGPLTAFDLLSDEDAQVIVDEVASWLDGCFERMSPGRELEPAEAV
jgi:pimeloyl-ACP methyl ester carboxylesterase